MKRRGDEICYANGSPSGAGHISGHWVLINVGIIRTILFVRVKSRWESMYTR
ncbi:MAG: hypothetical protein R6U10_02045 [Thermoplasmatota archaeon]